MSKHNHQTNKAAAAAPVDAPTTPAQELNEALAAQAPADPPVVQKPSLEATSSVEAPVVAGEKVIEVSDFEALGLKAKHSESVTSLIGRVLATGDTAAASVIQDFDNFIAKTGPEFILTTSEFAEAQLMVFRAIQKVVNDLGESQAITLVTVLRMIEETGEYGTLSGAKVFRYGDFSRLSMFEREAYVDVWNALHLLAPVKGRKDVTKFMDLSNLTKGGAFTESGVQRLITFAKGEV
jgi:hypothetical protein